MSEVGHRVAVVFETVELTAKRVAVVDVAVALLKRADGVRLRNALCAHLLAHLASPIG